MPFTQNVCRLGIFSALSVARLIAVYGVILAVGISVRLSTSDPVGNSYFSLLEILIILMMPLFVTLMVGVPAWAPVRATAYTLSALMFVSLLAGLTSSVHLVILTVSRQAAFSQIGWLPLLTYFRWPSITYALDILAWDFLFTISMLFAQQAFGGGRLATWVRSPMFVSGTLALPGLAGGVVGDVRLRNIGAVGYVGVFPMVAILLARLFSATPAQES